MADLSPPARAILEVLVGSIEDGRIVAGRPETYVGYKELHDKLQLRQLGGTFGESLRRQGLDDLAEWTKEDRHPAITGLIVGQEDFLPGPGYFKAFRRVDDFPWWTEQVVASVTYNWRQFLPTATTDTTPPTTIVATDISEPPERVSSLTYRVLRDTEIARWVKLVHSYECQLCGHTITLPDGSRYAEAHHIHPLGQPHNGPDVSGNLLCVCPNHHAELDYGVRQLDVASLRLNDRHQVSQKFIDYHNQFIHGRD